MKTRLLLLMILTALTGCTADTSDLQQFVARVATSTPPPIEPYPEFKPIPPFIYKAQDERSPFVRPGNRDLALQDRSAENCNPPNAGRAKQPLEAYGTDALKIQGFFTSQGRNWALIMANDGALHRVTVGDHLGLFFGKITRITQGAVYFTEQLPDGAGCWQEKQSRLTLSDGPGEVNNV